MTAKIFLGLILFLSSYTFTFADNKFCIEWTCTDQFQGNYNGQRESSATNDSPDTTFWRGKGKLFWGGVCKRYKCTKFEIYKEDRKSKELDSI